MLIAFQWLGRPYYKFGEHFFCHLSDQHPFWTHCVKLEREQYQENENTSQYEFFKSCVQSFLEIPGVKGSLILVGAVN